MHRVSIEAGDDWHGLPLVSKENPYTVPRGIRGRCAYCNSFQTFKCTGHTINRESNTITMKATCITCGDGSTALMIGAVHTTRDFAVKPKEFWITPPPSMRSLGVDLSLITGLHSDRIQMAYKSSVELYNANEHVASIASCGRVLEGISKTKITGSQSKASIGKLFKKLEKGLEDKSEFIEFIRPILSLGEALRLGRNPSDHFDLAVEPSRELAGKILDLIEFLMTYIYVMPGESQRVEEMIKDCRPADEEPDYQDEASVEASEKP